MSAKFDLKGDPGPGQDLLKDIALTLGRKNGAFYASRLDLAMAYKVKKLPTGIFYLDWYTGGGIPLDRITRIGGWSPVSNINDVTGDVEIEFPTLKAEEAL